MSHFNLYGWGRFRCGGVLSEPWFAYAILCACTFIQNFSVNGANNAVISTLERAFHLNSVQSGLFLALYDLATVCSAPVIGYLGDFYPSPIFFAFNMIVVAMGNVLIASSNFVIRDNRLNLNDGYLQQFTNYNDVLYECSSDPLLFRNETEGICSKARGYSDGTSNAKILLYLGNFVNGIGSVALFTVGVAYIERIFPRQRAAYCQGIYFAIGTLGGALGIVVTGRFLSLYTKLIPKRRLPSWLIPSHPLWIGCWWLPYLIYGFFCFLIGVFVSGLPNFKRSDRNELAVQSETVISTISASEDPPLSAVEPSVLTDFSHSMEKFPPSKPDVIHHAYSTDAGARTTPHSQGESWRNICSMIMALMKNSRYVLIIVANLFEGILLKGFVPFVSKYFEYQHRLDTSTATLVTGAIALVSVLVGCPLGAYFMNKYSWNPMRCARVCGLVFIFSAFTFLFLIFSCPELKFQYTTCSTVNRHCCDSIYRPVCDDNNPQQMFVSPCHYGCQNETTMSDGRTTHYSSCECANNATTTLSETACQFRIIPCLWIFILTLTGAALVVFFTAFIQVPMLQVLLYSVPLSHQSMALALRQTIVRVFGQTTGPILFGFIFDQSCLFWLTDCYGRQTCKVYHNHRMGLSMAFSGFSTRMITGVACLCVHLVWKWKYSHENLPAPVGTIRPADQ